MKIHSEFNQLSDEWFLFKLGKFGSTDAQALSANGAGLITLVYEKIGEKMTGKRKDSYTNEDMERGIALENLARSAFEIETGLSVKQVGLIEHDEFTIASPDGLVKEDSVAEFKCPNAANFVKYLYERKIPTQYVWQLQFQLFVSGRKLAYYCNYNQDFEKPLIITEVARDEEAIGKIKAGLLEAVKRYKEIYAKI